jgi:hypothetical protein
METQSPKLLDQVRETLRAKHYSYRTEQTYVDRIKRFILFHNKRHPIDLHIYWLRNLSRKIYHGHGFVPRLPPRKATGQENGVLATTCH